MIRENLDMLLEWLKRVIRSRLFWIGTVTMILFFLMCARLYRLQIQDGAAYYSNYVNRTTREILTPAVRGNIYDRNGELLAGNEIVYNLTIQDLGIYGKTDFNRMLLRLIGLMRRFDVPVPSECPVFVNEHGEFEFISGNDTRIRQFIRDIYGKAYIEKQAKEGVDVYSYDTPAIMSSLLSLYYVTEKDLPGFSELSLQDQLDICNIRYAMSGTSFTRYRYPTIATDVSEDFRTAVLEAQAELIGVEIEKGTKRVYPDSIYFSGILGYIGRPSSEELEQWQEIDETYTAADFIGKSGLEKVYEAYLAGRKGVKTATINNVGLVQEVISETESVRGADAWLSLDKELTVACYHLLEQRLAAIITSKLVDESFTPDASMLADDFLIPVTDAYFQMINNNILDPSHFTAEDATPNERAISEAYRNYHSLVLDNLREELTGDHPTIRTEAGEELSGYFDYILELLTDKTRAIIISSRINREDETYRAWVSGAVSLQEYLRYCVFQGWVDPGRLLSDTENQSRYSDAETVYLNLVNRIIELLSEDSGFMKQVYRIMINNGFLPGNQICMALIDQGILSESQDRYNELRDGDARTAYEFMLEKIEKIEITPAQLALDPCSGSTVVVDEDTGELLAVVTYPGYDLNRFSGSVDPVYWNKLTNDLSSPLYNRATQARTAPGSTYKMITATAALQEGVVTSDELIECEGIFDKLDHPMCWIAREQEGGHHGELNTAGGLAMSCNCYFYELGYRLSLNEDNEYDSSVGIERLNRYAAMYGFGEATGIEIPENISALTTEFPVTSAIGQGTNNFTTISLARYATCVATEGTLYRFLLLDRIADEDGRTILEAGPSIENRLDIPQHVWDVLHEGMYGVTHTGSAAALFTDCEVEIAGKSGSAQENKLRGNHGMFVSFAPYDDPEIVVAVSIPNGYTAGNSGLVSKEIYRYYFGYITLDDIRNNDYARNSGNTTIGD